MRSQLGHQWRGLTAGVIAGLAWTAAKVSVPALVAVAIDRGIGDGSNSALLKWSLAILAAGVVAGVCSGLRRWFAFREARWAEAMLRDRIFAHLQRLHFAFHDEVQTGQLMSRANTDLQQVQAFVVMIPITISNAATVLAAAVIMFSINPLLALLALGPLPFVNVLARRFSGNLFPSVMAIQVESAELATVVEETVSGIRVVKGFGSESVQSAKLRGEANDVYDRSLDATRVRARYMPAMDLLPNLGLLAVLGYGGHLVLDGQLTIGELVAFNTYVALLIWPLRMLGQIVAQGQRAAAAAGRVAEVLGTDPKIVDHAQPRKLPPIPAAASRDAALGEVRFEGVSFAYHDNGPAVLDGLDLVVEPGASVALVGATGCGKTTVARLIPRFYDVTEGRVCIDGVDVRDLRVHELRRAIGIVFEDTFLFNDTVRANIAFADPDVTDDAVAARVTARGRARVHHGATRRLRLDHRRAWLLALGRPASAHRHRAGDRRRSAGADPRRRDKCSRPDEGARDPRRARRGDARPDDDRHRAPSRRPSPSPTASSCSSRVTSWRRARTTLSSARASGIARSLRPARTSDGRRLSPRQARPRPRRGAEPCGAAAPSARRIGSTARRRGGSWAASRTCSGPIGVR